MGNLIARTCVGFRNPAQRLPIWSGRGDDVLVGGYRYDTLIGGSGSGRAAERRDASVSFCFGMACCDAARPVDPVTGAARG